MKKINQFLMMIAVLTILSGCQLTKKVSEKFTKKEYSMEEIVHDGKVDVKKAREMGYVSYDEKEKLGYYTLEAATNKKVHKKAMAEKDKIYAEVLPEMEKITGQKVKILGMRAIFPYSAVDIEYKTTEPPYSYGTFLYGLDSDGYVEKNGYADMSASIAERVTKGLYYEVYQDEIKQIEDYILKTYPKYQGFYGHGKENMSLINNVVKIAITWGPGGEENDKAMERGYNEVYQLYKENPHRSNEEWRKILESKKFYYQIYINLVTKKEEEAPTKEEAKQIYNDIQKNKLFSPYYSKGVALYSNITDKNSNAALYWKSAVNHDKFGVLEGGTKDD